MPDLTPDDLDAVLALDIPDDLDTVELSVPDTRTATRALRRLAILDRQGRALVDDAAAELAAIDELVQPERDRIAMFLDDRLIGIQRARDWTLRGLEQFARAVHADDPKAVTIKVSAGEVRLRNNPPKIVVTDNEAAAAALPTAVKPVEVQPAVAKKLLKPSGDRAQPVTPLAVEIPEGYHAEWAVNADGETVPGVVFLVADRKRFEWDAS